MKELEEKQSAKIDTKSITLDPEAVNQADTWEDFISLWMVCKEIDIKNQWAKGDIADRLCIKHGESSLGKFASDVSESIRSLEHYRRVSRAFPEDQRFLQLEWTHYFHASFTDSFKKGKGTFEGSERFDWVKRAHDKSWSTVRLKEEIKKADRQLDDGGTYLYYGEYLDKVRNVLMHIEKKNLTKGEREKLTHKLSDIYNEFVVYLK